MLLTNLPTQGHAALSERWGLGVQVSTGKDCGVGLILLEDAKE